MNINRGIFFGLVLALCWTGNSQAASVVEPRGDTDEWMFILNFPMVWLPDISGEFDAGGGDRFSLDKPIEDTLEDLDMGFIGEAYARRGPWTFGFRTMYLSTASDTRTEPIGLPGFPPLVGSHKVTVESDLFTSDLFAAYNFNRHFGLYTGVRRSGTKIDVKIRANEDDPGLIELPRNVELADEELFDWIAGVNLEYPFGKNDSWRFVVEADSMIDGDNDTNYQFNGFFSKRFNDRHAIWFGYRYLRMVRDVDVDGAPLETDFTQSGPTLGWAFIFE